MRNGFFGMVLCSALLAGVAPVHAAATFTRVTPDIAVGSAPLAVASADFNGDNKADLVFANNGFGEGPPSVVVLYGKGDGTFLAPLVLTVGTGPAAIAVGDFNGDQKPDIVVADDGDDTVSVLLNLDGTTFGEPLTIDTGFSPAAIVVGDFNHDNKLDVATADFADDTVTILLGNGDGTLQPGNSISVGDVGVAPLGLVAVNVDGDLNLDLVVSNSGGGPDQNGSITVLKGVGDGTFTAQPEIPSALFDYPGAIVAADFDGDHNADLAVVNQGAIDTGNTVTILKGDGTGAFQILSPRPVVGEWPFGIVAADLDGDGKVDLATSNLVDDSVSVLAGLGNATFSPKVDFSVAPTDPLATAGPAALVAVDLDGDQKPDLITANEDEDTASVLRNTTAAASVCVGNCDGGGEVTVDEIIILVNMVLGSQTQLSACPHGIPSSITDVSQVDVTVVIQAVNNALGTCPQTT